MTLRIDYAGAEAMMAALERDAVSDAAVDSLLDIHGVSMMVDNVARLVPEVERADFRTAIQEFVRTGRVADEHIHFNLRKARSERERIRALLTYIRENEQAVLERTLAVMTPYAPETGPLHLKAYLMAGGTSTGFVRTTPEGDVFYFNLADAAGDCDAAMLHIAHETFHLVQKAALRRAGLAALADSVESVPLPGRWPQWSGRVLRIWWPTRSGSAAPLAPCRLVGVVRARAHRRRLPRDARRHGHSAYRVLWLQRRRRVRPDLHRRRAAHRHCNPARRRAHAVAVSARGRSVSFCAAHANADTDDQRPR